MQATHDYLTGLLNKKGLLKALETQLHTHCSLFIVDLVGLNLVNEAYGHENGDKMLIAVSDLISDCAPQGSIVARIGGDEFALVVRSEHNSLHAIDIAQKIINAISRPWDRLGNFRIGCSIGIYSGPQTATSQMLCSANSALSAAKLQGRNAFRLCDHRLEQSVTTRRDLEFDLPVAVENGAVEIWFQPIMRDFGGRLDCFEALMRWNHPKYGWVAPPEILHIASSTGFSMQLFSLLLRGVTSALRRFDDEGFDSVRVAMNISPREMAQLPVDDIILTELKELHFSTERLEVEITEETAVDIALIRGKLAVLSSSGISIAIDDFGAGYSSLSCIKHFNANRVKIDRAFVTDIATSKSNAILVEAILQISVPFGFDVIAEGVETQDDVNKLTELGCSRMQGYFFGKPMPSAAAIDWLKNR